VDNFFLSAIVDEISPQLAELRIARLASTDSDLAISFRGALGQQLTVSLDRAAPGIYLSRRSETNLRTVTPFLALAQKELVGAKVTGLRKVEFDRIVEMGIEKTEEDKSIRRLQIVLRLTGRSTNALLIDEHRSVIGSWFELDSALTDRVKGLPGLRSESVEDSMTEAEVLETFFDRKSIFGPLLRNEYLARRRFDSPADSLRSLLRDLTERPHVGFVYSRVPLEEAADNVLSVKEDLILSHIELASAAGMFRREFETLSEAAEVYFRTRKKALELRTSYEGLRQKITREIRKRESTLSRIRQDRDRFGDPAEMKRCGDLILANLSTAKLHQNKVTLIDYHNPELLEVEIELPEGLTLKESAAEFFNRYRKANNAIQTTRERESKLDSEISSLRSMERRLDTEPNRQTIQELLGQAQKLLPTRRTASPTEKPASRRSPPSFGRWFRSSDGYEIGVGRSDTDNDGLTFRVARSNDLWFHTADYPGSHVIVRNPNRKEVPHRTIQEAAALAAFNSQARREGKAAVHYTQKKFVSKPPRSKPGLVRLSSFKSIVVEPRADLKKIE